MSKIGCRESSFPKKKKKGVSIIALIKIFKKKSLKYENHMIKEKVEHITKTIIWEQGNSGMQTY